MQTRFSDELEKVVEYAREEAMRTGYYAIGTEHLMLGVLRHARNAACEALEAEGMDLDLLKSSLDAQILREESIPFNEIDEVFLSREAQNTLSLAIVEASKLDLEEAGAGDLLLAITGNEFNPCCGILATSGIDRGRLAARLSNRGTARSLSSVPYGKDLEKALLIGLEKIGQYLDNDTKTFS